MNFVAVNNFGDTREGGLAGPMGLFIILLMAIATVLLIRNMNKRLRRLPDSFDKVGGARDGATAARSATPPTGGEAAPGASTVDNDRSLSATGSQDAQVSDVPTDDRPASADGDGRRSG